MILLIIILPLPTLQEKYVGKEDISHLYGFEIVPEYTDSWSRAQERLKNTVVVQVSAEADIVDIASGAHKRFIKRGSTMVPDPTSIDPTFIHPTNDTYSSNTFLIKNPLGLFAPFDTSDNESVF